jgi:hypothetical protein
VTEATEYEYGIRWTQHNDREYKAVKYQTVPNLDVALAVIKSQEGQVFPVWDGVPVRRPLVQWEEI